MAIRSLPFAANPYLIPPSLTGEPPLDGSPHLSSAAVATISSATEGTDGKGTVRQMRSKRRLQMEKKAKKKKEKDSESTYNRPFLCNSPTNCIDSFFWKSSTTRSRWRFGCLWKAKIIGRIWWNFWIRSQERRSLLSWSFDDCIWCRSSFYFRLFIFVTSTRNLWRKLGSLGPIVQVKTRC